MAKFPMLWQACQSKEIIFLTDEAFPFMQFMCSFCLIPFACTTQGKEL